jgi:hypothetical protein
MATAWSPLSNPNSPSHQLAIIPTLLYAGLAFPLSLSLIHGSTVGILSKEADSPSRVLVN